MSATRFTVLTIAALAAFTASDAAFPSLGNSAWGASPVHAPTEHHVHRSLSIEHRPGERFRFQLDVDAARPRMGTFRGFLHRQMHLAREINIQVAAQAVESLAAPAPPVYVQPEPVVVTPKPVCPPVRCVPRRRLRRY